MGKKTYIIRRIAQLFVLYIAIATMLFLLFRLAPGDPMASFMSGDMTSEQIDEIRENYGLDEPLYIQYWSYITNILVFEFGYSYTTGQAVSGMVLDRLWNTVVLMGTAIVIAYLIGVPFGAYLAWKRGSRFEKFGVVFVLISRSAPAFWTGLLAIYIVSARWGLLPAGGMTTAGTEGSGLDIYLSLDFLRHLILPATVLAFYFASLPALLMRNSMLEVMKEDYVRFAELKGVNSRVVMIKHAARTALLPIITAFAIAAGYAIGGSVLIETVFSWPGLGRLMVRSVTGADYPVAQATFLLLAMLVLIANFFADLMYSYLDPRITYE